MLLVKHLYLSITLWFKQLLCAPIGATLSNRLQNRSARVILGYRNEHGHSKGKAVENVDATKTCYESHIHV